MWANIRQERIKTGREEIKAYVNLTREVIDKVIKDYYRGKISSITKGTYALIVIVIVAASILAKHT